MLQIPEIRSRGAGLRSSVLQVSRGPGLLGNATRASFNPRRMHEPIPRVWNMLEKHGLIPQSDVIEQHEMLMNLAHVSNVGRGRQAKTPGENAHGEKFRNSGH